MAYRIEELKQSVEDKWSKDQFGYCIYDIVREEKISGEQLAAIIKGLSQVIKYIPPLDPNQYSFIVDEDGNKAIVPEIYNLNLKNYDCIKAFFSNMLPPMLITRICEDGKVGILYYLYEYGIDDNTKTPFLNDDAIEILKKYDPEEIEQKILVAHRMGKTRKRNKE